MDLIKTNRALVWPRNAACSSHGRVAGRRSGRARGCQTQFSRSHLLRRLTCTRRGSWHRPCPKRRSPCSSQPCRPRSSWIPCEGVSSTCLILGCRGESTGSLLCGTS
ncbi:Terpenoid synthases superfamily protein [Zea mays]|uniref:Terpenoid synthases superfamily protein n=1 Tax=Zea mays TaxID=4577 RepID=A0A1D6LKM4_MAIZE|nr:Terpenoid synthases superfamily protein [Zea mays]